MSGNGFEVDPEALDEAAGKIRTAVADGTLETQCFAWGNGYGHPGLSAALRTFVADVDTGVDQLAAKAEALAVDLVDQAADYHAVDASAQGRLTNPFLAPAPVTPGPWAPPAPVTPGPWAPRAPLAPAPPGVFDRLGPRAPLAPAPPGIDWSAEGSG